MQVAECGAARVLHFEPAGGDGGAGDARGGGLQVQLYIPRSANQAPELEYARLGAALTREQLHTIERGMRAANVTSDLEGPAKRWVRRPSLLFRF